MKQFHEPTAGGDEDISVLHFTVHLLMYHSTQLADIPTYIYPARTLFDYVRYRKATTKPQGIKSAFVRMLTDS